MFYVQGFLLLAMCGVVRAAEYLNAFLSSNWRAFATQNYFDPRGIFIGIVFCAPIVLILVTQLVMAISLPCF